MIIKLENIENLTAPDTEEIHCYVSTDAMEVHAILRNSDFFRGDGLYPILRSNATDLALESRNINRKDPFEEILVNSVEKSAGFPVISRIVIPLDGRRNPIDAYNAMRVLDGESQNMVFANDVYTRVYARESGDYRVRHSIPPYIVDGKKVIKVK